MHTLLRPTLLRLRPRLSASVLFLAATSMVAGCATPVPLNTPPARSAPATAQAPAVSATPQGEVKGSAWQHTVASAQQVVMQANVALPAGTTGMAGVSFGKWRDLPAQASQRVPVVIFLSGSTGLSLKAIEEWQRWLATKGVASVAPDSFALPDRLTYKSPVSRDIYERVHALRASEIDIALMAVRAAPWADPQRIVIAGTSEGAVAVARHSGAGFAGRMLFAWSCENNYFVSEHRTALGADVPVLNVISSSDPFFTSTNPFLGVTGKPVGHCGPVLATHKRATIVLIPGAPHTLINLPAARHAVEGFVEDVLKAGLH